MDTMHKIPDELVNHHLLLVAFIVTSALYTNIFIFDRPTPKYFQLYLFLYSDLPTRFSKKKSVNLRIKNLPHET